MLQYFRGRWPEEPVPDGCPVWINYEVDIGNDAVLRSVEIFADGRSIRNSLALEERDGIPCTSLVHGPFMENVADWPLEKITTQAFIALWEKSSDSPSPR